MSTPKYISLDNLIHYDANIKNIIPTRVSELENDSNFISSESVQQMIDDSIANLDTGSSGGSNTGSSGDSNTGTILYDVDVNNANFYDITISQSAENFTKFDICACTDARELTFTSVYNPNNNNFNIYSMNQESGELIIKTKQYRITGAYISPVNGIGGMSSISSNGVIVNSGDYIGIYKVIGYKNI